MSWSFVLTRCCTLTWVTKSLMRTISNVYAGRRFPTPVLRRGIPREMVIDATPLVSGVGAGGVGDIGMQKPPKFLLVKNLGKKFRHF